MGGQLLSGEETCDAKDELSVINAIVFAVGGIGSPAAGEAIRGYIKLLTNAEQGTEHLEKAVQLLR